MYRQYIVFISSLSHSTDIIFVSLFIHELLKKFTVGLQVIIGRTEMHIQMKFNFMGLKFDLSWQDLKECSRVVVINAITNLALKRNMMFDKEYLLQVIQRWDKNKFAVAIDKDLLDI